MPSSLRATSERDNAWSELREAKAAQQAAEANAKAKQKEVDDVVKAYQELGVEKSSSRRGTWTTWNAICAEQRLRLTRQKPP